MKKSFILHIDSLDILDDLTIEQSGKLFKAIRDYHKGIEPELDAITKIAFSPFKNQFIRDDKSYQKTCDKNSIKGKIGNLKRYNIELYNQLKDDYSNLDELLELATSRQTRYSDKNSLNSLDSDSDSDSDNDSKNDSVSKNDIKKSLVDKKSTTKAKTDSAKYFVECRDLYFKFVNAKFNIDPLFKAKDGIALSELLNILEKRARDKDPNIDYTLEFCINKFTFFLNTAYKIDFIKDKFTIPILLSQFNQILFHAQKNN